MLDAQQLGSQVDDFFATVEDQIAKNVTDTVLPFIGKVGDLPTLGGLPSVDQLTEKLEAFKQQIHLVIDKVNDPDFAQAVADAITAANITGLTATKTAEGGVALGLDYGATVNTGKANIDLGDSVGSFLDLDISAGASIGATLKTTLLFSEAGKYSIGDQVDPEIVVDITSDLDINDLTAKLGVVTATVKEHVPLPDEDPVAPELVAKASIDITNGVAADPSDPAPGFVFTKALDVQAGLHLDFDGQTILGLLPDINGELIVGIPVTKDGIGDVSVKVQNVTLDLDDYLGIISDIAGSVGGVFNATPFSQIIDVALAPVPGLDGLANKFGLIPLFDTVGGIDGKGDGHITVGDLAVLGNPSLEPAIDAFYQVLAVIDLLRKVGDTDGLGKISIGDGSLLNGVTTSTKDPSEIQAEVIAKLGTLADTVLPKNVVDFLSSFEVNSGFLKAAADPNDGTFSFGLLEHPEDVLKLLLTDETVDLIEFNVPAFDFTAHAGGLFPVIGPLGFVLEGDISAHIDFNVGYDSYGLAHGNALDGFYFSTNADNPLIPPNLSAFDPVGTVGLTISGGAGVGYAGSRLSVDAFFSSTLAAYFEGVTDPNSDGKFRPGVSILEGCPFSPVVGTAEVGIRVTIKIDFGLFDVTKHINIVNENLGDFTVFECPPPIIEPTPEAPGLATAQGSNLLLNVGPRADLRKTADHEDGVIKHIGPVDDPDTKDVDEAAPEGYVIGRARDVVKDNLTGPDETAVVDGKLDVSAFGFTQRADMPTLIKGDFAAGNDFLVIQDDVAVDSRITGGSGDDFLQGGAGRDTLYGDDDANKETGFDTLNGRDGDDKLYGGKGDDILSGGKGGDLIDGGEGYDTVSYEDANRDSQQGVTIFIGPGGIKGSGGEADGDTLVNVESIIGTAYDDRLFALTATSSVFLDAGDGDDVMLGSAYSDLLLGGKGADVITGGLGETDASYMEDGTSYITSWAAIDVDLLRDKQRGGDAEGDRLTGVEDIQGSTFDDTVKGNARANAIDTGDGDDTIDGRGGVDTITAGSGNDKIFANGDGDYIDGGDGRDTLSYENRFFSGVFVNLGNAQNPDGSFNTGLFGAPDRIVAESHTELIFTIIESNNSTIENLTGSRFGDTLIGDIDDNRLTGLAGNDTIAGGDGFDFIVGGAGADHMDGGAGIDWVEYGSSEAGVIADLTTIGSGGDAQGDTYKNLENILGSNFSDTLRGDDANNIIDPFVTYLGSTDVVDGRDGTDTLRINYSGLFVEGLNSGVGGGFTDFAKGEGTFLRLQKDGKTVADTVSFSNIERLDIVGTTKTDIIVGGTGADTIVTLDGNDIVSTGTGADVVNAGDGNDIVAYGTGQNGLLTPNSGASAFKLDGGYGIDAFYLSLTGATYDVKVSGAEPDSEFYGTNLVTAKGGAIRNFEILRDAFTGSGDDSVTQVGRIDNIFNTGDGNDVIRSGLGRDVVDGGLNTDGLGAFTPITDTLFVAPVLDKKAAAASGDTLVLDYSALEDGYRVVSATEAAVALGVPDSGQGNLTAVLTNQGAYATISIAQFGDSGLPESQDPDDARDLTTFRNIERLDVTGSQHNDIIVGSDGAFDPGAIVTFGAAAPIPTPQVAGDDVLRGLDGDDEIYGKSGDDLLYGGAGEDYLQGTNVRDPDLLRLGGGRDVDVRINDISRGNDEDVAARAVVIDRGEPNGREFQGHFDRLEIDRLTGGSGADTFVVGDQGGTYYIDANINSSSAGRAIITDFDATEGDVIQLWNGPNLYRTEETSDGTLIFYRDGSDRLGGADDLIAEVVGVFGLDLDSAAFSYVGSSERNFARMAEAAAPTSFVLADPAASTVTASTIDRADPGSLAPASAVQAFASLLKAPEPVFDVKQESDIAVLKSALDGASGASSSKLSISGSAAAVGTFTGDPFGLGKGIILSTGQVKDLPGANTAQSAGSNVTSLPIVFEKVGRSADGNSDIFRANLSGLNVDIRSITLKDSGAGTGGAGGVASGFDVGAIALSTKFVPNGNGFDLDNPATLPKLDVFEFSNSAITYTPGGQHAPGSSGFDYGSDLFNSTNGLVQTDIVKFDTFAGSTSDGISLGDGGSIGFDLKDTVSSSGPLYLYISEVGAQGEVISGTIDISGDTVVPTGDLSTDLGAIGENGDDTMLTYAFTPKVGDNAFSFDMVLFTEELPEFDGVDLSDYFSIKLNGVEIGALSNGAALTLKSLVYSASGDLIMNPVGTGPLADKIKADAYTKTLTISGPVNAGSENVLTIEVRDGRDAYLDSGILIKDGSFKTFALPAFTITPLPGGEGSGGFDGKAEAGGDFDFTISLPPGTDLPGPIDVTIKPSDDVDVGGGPGKPVTVTFTPDGPLTIVIDGKVAPDAYPDQDGTITFDVDGDGSAGGIVIPPIVIDIIPPTPNDDPFLIFEARSGDIMPGFTAGNDTVDGSGRPGPTTFHLEGMTTGKDVIKGFGSNDILVVDEKLYDSNKDGIITFGKNKSLDLDGPDKGKDLITFRDPAVTGLRYLGTDHDGHYVYGNASVRPKGAKESLLGDDVLTGDAKNAVHDIFFFDSALDMNLGSDVLNKVGGKDLIVTTSALFDKGNDKVIEAGIDHRFDLSGNSYFDATHGGDQQDKGPFGQFSATGMNGANIDTLYFDGSVARAGVTYYVYSAAQVSIDGLHL